MEYMYRCVSFGPVNNGLKPSCTFELKLPEGPHNCPLCGQSLERFSEGPSVSELLRRGASKAANAQTKNQDEK